jgi:CBS-domain-containing membrane protein
MMMKATRVARAKTVRDVMKPRVVTVVPEMTARELVQTFLEERVRGAPVLGPTGKVIGIVSETDVLRLAFRARPPAEAENARAALDLDQVRVGDIMGPVGHVLTPGDTLERVAETFASDGAQRAVVMDNGMLLGIVTPADLMRTLDVEG